MKKEHLSVKRRSYPVGTRKMDTGGDVYIRTPDGWIRENRFVASNALLDRDLKPGERVFHKDNTLRGTAEFNKPSNLVVIQQAVFKFRLRSSRILYVPQEAHEETKERIPARRKSGTKSYAVARGLR